MWLKWNDPIWSRKSEVQHFRHFPAHFLRAAWKKRAQRKQTTVTAKGGEPKRFFSAIKQSFDIHLTDEFNFVWQANKVPIKLLYDRQPNILTLFSRNFSRKFSKTRIKKGNKENNTFALSSSPSCPFVFSFVWTRRQWHFNAIASTTRLHFPLSHHWNAETNERRIPQQATFEPFECGTQKTLARNSRSTTYCWK